MSILEVKNVSIRYQTGDFKDIGLKEYILRKLKGNYKVTEFWADQDISFSLEKGDILGIVGTNGAGKSTLLKTVSGIMDPTEGHVKREGNVAALLELASGFDGDLTVKENTYLRGAMLGYTRAFMNETYDQIIDFAELREFEHRPFKQLSSGMKARLAFSIASLVNPDILILDEVLSVGDGAFRQKSEARMKELIHSGATTILVSHSLEQIRSMCNKVLWLHKGRQVTFSENVEEVCAQYQKFLGGTVSEYELFYPGVFDTPCFCEAEEAVSVSICGCCASRDPFGFRGDNTDFPINCFIQSNSPYSSLAPSLKEIGLPEIDEEDCDAAVIPFWRRLFLTEVRKSLFHDLKESGSDWLLLDLSEMAYDLTRITNRENGKSTVISAFEAASKCIKGLREGKLSNCDFAEISSLDMDREELFQALREFLSRIKEIYPSERIILHEVYRAPDYLSPEGFRYFPANVGNQKRNELVRQSMEIAREMLPDSYEIRSLKGIYGDPEHRWGINSRYYVDKYYDYVLKAVDVIIRGSEETKQEKLDFLYDAYSDWFNLQRKRHPVYRAKNPQ